MAVAYFGDQFYSDVHATFEYNERLKHRESNLRWEAFAVIEELTDLDESLDFGSEARLIPHNTHFWGPSYFLYEQIDPITKDKTVQRDYFLSEVAKVSQYAGAFVKNITRLMPKGL